MFNDISRRILIDPFDPRELKARKDRELDLRNKVATLKIGDTLETVFDRLRAFECRMPRFFVAPKNVVVMYSAYKYEVDIVIKDGKVAEIQER